MATAPVRLVRGQPPSPPQSNDGDLISDPQQDPCGIPAIYEPQDTYMAPAPPISYDAGGSQPMSTSSSSQMQSVEYSRAVQLHYPMPPSGFQINTPPPSDESFGSSSVEPAPQWSPPPQRFRGQDMSKARVVRTARVRNRRDKMEAPRLTAPLSELTKHMTHIPLRDMHKWVNRSIEERRRQVISKNGKVARPMNSFMLYRSAYAERTKEWVSKNNHQVVSKIAGESWKLESREVKKEFEQLAVVEKANHVKAHPGYKFSPKDKNKRVRPGHGSPSMSTIGTPESSPAFTNTMIPGDFDGNHWDSRGSTPYMEHGLPNTFSYLNTPYHMATGGRTSSGMVPHPDYAYNPAPLHQGFDDPRYRRSEYEDLAYASPTALAGLPGGASQELLQPYAPPPQGTTDGGLDPQLLRYSNETTSPLTASNLYGNSQYLWPETATTNSYVPTTSASLPPGQVSYHVGQSYDLVEQDHQWDNKLENNGVEGHEFDKWVEP